tara:strand:- start:31 stop:885 length:855 start_codon:yes stop_codon:yes gene_type:complete
MPYLGSAPKSGFISNAKERYTGITTAYIDLNQSITSLADVIVWVNFVKQDSTNLTLTTSTRITLGATLVASDIVEVVYLGKAVATQAPATGQVTSDMLAGSIANSKLSNSSITLNGSAVSLGGSATVGGNNTPVFAAYLASDSDQSISDSTTTKIAFEAERIDTDSAFDTSNNKFTVPSGGAGKYFIVCKVKCGSSQQNDIVGAFVHIYKNGSTYHSVGQTGAGFISGTKYPILGIGLLCATVIDLAVGDYIEGYGYIKTNGAGTPKFQEGDDQATYIEGFKLL